MLAVYKGQLGNFSFEYYKSQGFSLSKMSYTKPYMGF